MASGASPNSALAAWIVLSAMIAVVPLCSTRTWAFAESAWQTQPALHVGGDLPRTSGKNLRRRIVEIRFERSGGFAGRATNVAGVVHFAGGSAAVDSDSTGYHRPIEAAEAADLQRLALASIAKTAKSSAPGVPDAFQYAMSIQAENGRSKSLTIDPRGDSAAEGAPASSLDAWVLREIGRIWHYKLEKIKK